jgi:hypothetical protein
MVKTKNGNASYKEWINDGRESNANRSIVIKNKNKKQFPIRVGFKLELKTKTDKTEL